MSSNRSYVNSANPTKVASNGVHSTHPLLAGSSKRTVSWKQLPEWLKDNAYITDGYRPQLNSYIECAKSLFYLHNEFGRSMLTLYLWYEPWHLTRLFSSVNIWSHAIGFALFSFLGVCISWKSVFDPIAESRTIWDVVFFYTFIAGALSCLGLSSSYHCFSCHSEPVCIYVWGGNNCGICDTDGRCMISGCCLLEQMRLPGYRHIDPVSIKMCLSKELIGLAWLTTCLCTEAPTIQWCITVSIVILIYKVSGWCIAYNRLCKTLTWLCSTKVFYMSAISVIGLATVSH
jgi:hypothetical protein